MAIFVHFTDENNKNSIIKNGIKIETIHYDNINAGVFCMPVIPGFYATHQWVREIKQYKSGNNIIAVYFKIPDNEIVFCGKYNGQLIKVNATEAHKKFLELDDKMGFQVVIDRKILKNEITKIKAIPQIVGWRHFPQSHDRKRCLCPACLTKGSFNSKKYKKLEFKKLFKELQKTDDDNEIINILDKITDLKIKIKTGTKHEKILNKINEKNDSKIKASVINCIGTLYGVQYRDFYFKYIYNNEHNTIVEFCIDILIGLYGSKILDEIDKTKCNEETIGIINEFIKDYK